MRSVGRQMLRIAAALWFVLAVLVCPLASSAFVAVVAILLRLEDRR